MPFVIESTYRWLCKNSVSNLFIKVIKNIVDHLQSFQIYKYKGKSIVFKLLVTLLQKHIEIGFDVNPW